MNEDRGVRYQRLRGRATAGVAASGGGLLALLILTPGSIWLRDLASSLAGASPDRQGPLTWMIFAGLLFCLLELVTLPARVRRDYHLERRYGLTSRSAMAWLESHVTSVAGLAVAMVLATVLAYALMRWLPAIWWLPMAAGWMATAFVLSWLAPSLLFPLFWPATPLMASAPVLAERLQRLAIRAEVPALDVRAWHLGRDSARANAALVGLGRTQRVLLSDTLLETYSPEEIEVIVADELGHHRHRDLWIDLVCEGLITATALGLGSLVIGAAWRAFGLLGPADIAGLPLLILTGASVALVGAPARQALARAHERRADEFALRLTGNPAAMVSSLRRLGVQNMADVAPSALSRSLFASHPSVAERIARAQAWDG